MCGIIGVFNEDNAVESVLEGLEVVRERGRDGYGIAVEGMSIFNPKLSILKRNAKIKADNCVGHCLHSIVNLVEQPLIDKGKRFVVNCEIYNWKELNQKHKLDARNDAELLFKLIDKKGVSVLEEIDGVYAFAFWKNNEVICARDIFGVKPFWYSYNKSFSFASEKKVLKNKIEELNPRKVLIYDIKKKKIKFLSRTFFKIKPEHKKLDRMRLKGLLVNAVSKRIPDNKFGILFSGGVDSTAIALICKKLGVDFTCYTAAIDDKRIAESEDLIYSKRIAKDLGLKLKVKKIKIKELEKYVKKVVPLIEDSNVVKVEVALPFYLACEMAKKDGIKVMFSGLGSEEIFAGYQRHRESANVNNECVSGLLKMYERDLYRDDVVTMNNNLELRLPFLDKKLVDYSLKIPAKFKMIDGKDKLVFREVIEEMGLKNEYAFRKKRAAQYGSKFHKGVEKLTRESKLKLKADYLKQFLGKKNLKLGVLFSSGKDSMYAMHVMKKQNYEISCLVTIKSENKDSFMFHTPNVDLAKLQAEALGVPLIEYKTKGVKEKELKDMEKALKKAKVDYGIEGVVTGALFSNYQRERVEKVCDKLGLKIFFPLWHIDQKVLMNELIKNNYEVVISSVAADGLDEKWLGRKIDEKALKELLKLNRQFKMNVAGEGGEFESLVLDTPLFKKRIEIIKFKKEMDSECSGKFIVEKAKLVEK